MENSTANINQGRPVYFSYARNSKRKPEWEHISDSVDTLLETMTAYNLEYRVDVKDIGTGDKISKFEEEIGWNSEVVVIIFSDKYFRSPHCMYEFVQIKDALQHYPEKRLMCIKSGDFNLADSNYIMDLEQFWVNQKNEYERIEFHRLREHSGTEIAAHENGFYLDDIRNLYSFFSAINYSNAATINYESFVGDIVKYYKTTPKPKLTPKPKVQKLAKTEQLTTSTPQSATKKSPIIPIAIAAAVVLVIVIYALSGETIKTENTDNEGDVATVVSSYNNTDNNTSFEDYDAIIAKANELYDNDCFSEALAYYEKIADKLSTNDQSKIGYCYEKEKNYEKAVEFYQKSADKGNSTAQNNLGFCYQNGYGVPQDYSKAVEWYKKAAEQGNTSAQTNLGFCYQKGIGVAQNYEKAVEWYKKAAEQGNPNAQNNLGFCYQNGYGVQKNNSKAFELYQKAAEKGNDFAQNNLGFCYRKGIGVAQNYEKAIEWYKMAAEQGYSNAQFNLGYCYQNGIGFSKDISQAKYWYQKAADQGYEDAIEALKKL